MNDDSKRILVVDDEEMIRELLNETFQRKGYAVEATENGKEALKKLEGDPRVSSIDTMLKQRIYARLFCRRFDESDETDGTDEIDGVTRGANGEGLKRGREILDLPVLKRKKLLGHCYGSVFGYVFRALSIRVEERNERYILRVGMGI